MVLIISASAVDIGCWRVSGVSLCLQHGIFCLIVLQKACLHVLRCGFNFHVVSAQE